MDISKMIGLAQFAKLADIIKKFSTDYAETNEVE